MKIALVWVNGFDTNYVIPLSLGYLKSNSDNLNNDIRIIDCSLMGIDAKSLEFKKKLKEFNPDIVGFLVGH